LRTWKTYLTEKGVVQMSELEILLIAVAFAGGMLTGIMLTTRVVTRNIERQLRHKTINELVSEAEN